MAGEYTSKYTLYVAKVFLIFHSNLYNYNYNYNLYFSFVCSHFDTAQDWSFLKHSKNTTVTLEEEEFVSVTLSLPLYLSK